MDAGELPISSRESLIDRGDELLYLLVSIEALWFPVTVDIFIAAIAAALCLMDA